MVGDEWVVAGLGRLRRGRRRALVAGLWRLLRISLQYLELLLQGRFGIAPVRLGSNVTGAGVEGGVAVRVPMEGGTNLFTFGIHQGSFFVHLVSSGEPQILISFLRIVRVEKFYDRVLASQQLLARIFRTLSGAIAARAHHLIHAGKPGVAKGRDMSKGVFNTCFLLLRCVLVKQVFFGMDVFTVGPLLVPTVAPVLAKESSAACRLVEMVLVLVGFRRREGETGHGHLPYRPLLYPYHRGRLSDVSLAPPLPNLSRS